MQESSVSVTKSVYRITRVINEKIQIGHERVDDRENYHQRSQVAETHHDQSGNYSNNYVCEHDYKFITVIVSWRTVAKQTHNKYGVFIRLTHFAYGYIAHIAQMSVPSTSKISTAASRLLRKPNWIGVKIRLKRMLSRNGSKTIKVILLLKYR